MYEFLPFAVLPCTHPRSVPLLFAKVRRRLKKELRTNITLEHLIRLAAFIALYWLLYVNFVAFRVYLEIVQARRSPLLGSGHLAHVHERHHQDDIKNATQQQIMCSAATGQDCQLTDSLNEGAWFIEAFTVGGQGILFFITFGLSKVRLGSLIDVAGNLTHMDSNRTSLPSGYNSVGTGGTRCPSSALAASQMTSSPADRRPKGGKQT